MEEIVKEEVTTQWEPIQKYISQYFICFVYTFKCLSSLFYYSPCAKHQGLGVGYSTPFTPNLDARVVDSK